MRLALLATALWVGLALFVAVYDPRGQGTTDVPGWAEQVLHEVEPRHVLTEHGYEDSWEITAFEGENEADATSSTTRCWVRRQPLDRSRGGFYLAATCTFDDAEGLEGLDLHVTEDANWAAGDDVTWTLVDAAEGGRVQGREVVLHCQGFVGGRAVAYRIRELRGGVPIGGATRNMLTAPTLAGRVHEALATHPTLRWVPDLR